MTTREAVEGFEMDNVLLVGKEDGTVVRNNIAIEALRKQLSKEVHNIYPTEIEETGAHILTGDCPVCGSPVPAE